MKAGPLELSSSQLCPHGVGVACHPSSFGSRALCRLSRPRHLHSCWQTASLDGFSTLVGYFPGGSEGQESACSAGDVGSIPGSGRSPGEGHGNPLQYFSPGESQGQRSLAGYSPWGRQESDTTERPRGRRRYQWTVLLVRENPSGIRKDSRGDQGGETQACQAVLPNSPKPRQPSVCACH